MTYPWASTVAVDRHAIKQYAELVALPMGTLLLAVGDDYHGVALRVADTDDWSLTGYSCLRTSVELLRRFAPAWRVLGVLVDDVGDRQRG